ncbi:MAG TPA: tetratricopeptide repeat protein [Thermoanaerobaculia bacterium]|nr:tetratricopeptide repeat protein [Thermoanaerobaculia bacterium]
MTSPSPSLEIHREAAPLDRVGFAGFVLDRETGRLLGPEGEIRLRPQTFRLLEVLVESAPRILSQDELLDRAWGVEHLSPASVKQAISEIRQALGDDPARPSIIETVHRRGYRFIATIAPVEPELPASVKLAAVPPQIPDAPARRRPATLLSVSALVLLTLGLARLLPSEPEPILKTPAAIPARPALAILGFKNLSADSRDAWVSAALSELLAFELTAGGGVRLIPPDKVAWMSRELGLPNAGSLGAVGRNLGADLLLTGSYLEEDGGRLKLQVLVQSASTGETVAWARESGSRDALHGLAGASARGLQATLGGKLLREAAALASSSESLRLYAEAQGRLRVWDAMGAITLLEQAADIDPKSPFVQDALAAAALRLGFEVRAREAAQRAAALSAGLPREIRLGMEARSWEVQSRWEEAAKIYGVLRRSFPDDLEYGLRLAAAQRLAGRTTVALATVAGLRRLPPPAGDDPRLDLAEADVTWQLGHFERALDAAARGIAGAEPRGMALVVAAGRASRGWSLWRLGNPEGALAELDAARVLYLRTGDRGAAAATLLGRATVLQGTGRTAEAWKAYEEGISTLREIGDRRREARALNNFAAVLNDEGDLDGTVRLLERSLEIKRETGDLQGASTTLVGLGNAHRVRGDLKNARRRLEEALELSRGLNDDHGTAFVLRGLARLLEKEELFTEARRALEEAILLTSRIGHADGTAQARVALAELEQKTGRLDRAQAQLEQVLEEFRRLGQPGDEAYATLRLGEVHQEQGRLGAARTVYSRALALARSLRNDFYAAHAHLGLAEAGALGARPETARAEYRQALALWEKQGNWEEAEKARKALAEIRLKP